MSQTTSTAPTGSTSDTSAVWSNHKTAPGTPEAMRDTASVSATSRRVAAAGTPRQPSRPPPPMTAIAAAASQGCQPGCAETDCTATA